MPLKRSYLGLIVLGLSSLLLLPSLASATTGPSSGNYDTGWGGTAAPDETEGDVTDGTADSSGGAGGDTGGASSPATSGTPSSDSGTTGGEGSATEGETDADMDYGQLAGRGCTIGTGSPASGLTALAVLGLLGLRRRRSSQR